MDCGGRGRRHIDERAGAVAGDGMGSTRWDEHQSRTGAACLDVEDVDWQPDGLVVHIRRSKTDQEGKGASIGLLYGSDPATCPVRTQRAWLDAAGIDEEPILRHVDRHGRLLAARISGPGRRRAGEAPLRRRGPRRRPVRGSQPAGRAHHVGHGARGAGAPDDAAQPPQVGACVPHLRAGPEPARRHQPARGGGALMGACATCSFDRSTSAAPAPTWSPPRSTHRSARSRSAAAGSALSSRRPSRGATPCGWYSTTPPTIRDSR